MSALGAAKFGYTQLGDAGRDELAAKLGPEKYAQYLDTINPKLNGANTAAYNAMAAQQKKAEAISIYEKARAQQILDINGARGRSETILSDVFNNTPSGIATGVLK